MRTPKAITVKPKKRGRPATGGRNPLINVRLSPSFLEVLERWMRDQNPAPASRSEAIRQLLTTALKGAGYPVKD